MRTKMEDPWWVACTHLEEKVRGASSVMDDADLADVFTRRASAMKSTLRFVKGSYRRAVQVATTRLSPTRERL